MGESGKITSGNTENTQAVAGKWLEALAWVVNWERDTN